MGLYRLILVLIHLILKLKYYILYGIELSRRIFLDSIVGSRKEIKRARIHQDSKHLNKLPKHLSFIIVENNIYFVDLAQMIVWSMALGISYISVYDRNGMGIVFCQLTNCVTEILNF